MKHNFRVWDNLEKKYITNVAITNNGELIIIDNNSFYKADDSRYVIEHSIGKVDDNNKEIFENDIINTTKHIGTMKVVYSLKYSCFGLKYPHNDDNDCSSSIPYDDEYTLEVIGNIHENIELLDIIYGEINE